MSWLLLLALACSNHGPPPTTTTTTTTDAADADPDTEAEPADGAAQPADADPADPDESTCLEQCMRRHMARPVAPEIIEADCRQECAPEHTVRTAKDLELRLGERVIAVGVYQQTLHHDHGPEPYMGTAVVLSDGTPLWITTGDPPQGWAELVDKRIRVEGRVSTGDEADPGTWLTDVADPLPAGDDKPTLDAPK